MKHKICPSVSYIKNNFKNDPVLTIYDSTDGATCRIHNHEFHVHQTLNRWRHHDILPRSIWVCCYNLKTVGDQTEN